MATKSDKVKTISPFKTRYIKKEDMLVTKTYGEQDKILDEFKKRTDMDEVLEISIPIKEKVPTERVPFKTRVTTYNKIESRTFDLDIKASKKNGCIYILKATKGTIKEKHRGEGKKK